MGRLNIVLVEPEIPQNTGNIARTCACVGASLHLVRPLGFTVTDAKLKRAGLDYWHMLDITYHDNLDALMQVVGDVPFFLCSTKAPRCYCDVRYPEGCFLFFGRETKGLPEPLLKRYYDRCVRIPMVVGARSLNLSNAAAIVLYEAFRQQNFAGLLTAGSLPDFEE